MPNSFFSASFQVQIQGPDSREQVERASFQMMQLHDPMLRPDIISLCVLRYIVGGQQPEWPRQEVAPRG